MMSRLIVALVVIATVLGVFFSVLLGCGLFAAAFFSNKSGLDQQISDATRRERDHAGIRIANTAMDGGARPSVATEPASPGALAGRCFTSCRRWILRS